MKKIPLKLKTILILFTATLISVTLLVSGMLFFGMYEKSMVEKIGDSRVDVLSQISEKISAIKLNADLLLNLYYYNVDSTKLYEDKGYNGEEKAKIEERMREITDLSAMISAVTEMEFYYTFLLVNGSSYSSNIYEKNERLENYQNQIWFPKVLENDMVWIPTHINAEGRNVVSIAKSLNDTEGNFSGIFLFNIYEECFYEKYQNLVEKNEIYIVDESGNIVSHSDKSMLGIRFYDMELLDILFGGKRTILVEKNKKEYLFSIVKNEELNWTIAEEIPMSILMEDVEKIQFEMIWTGMGIFGLSLLICYFIAKKTTRPLGQLVLELENVGKSENAEQIFVVQGWREIHKICEECNYMVGRIRSLVAEIKESEKKKRVAEIGFLQSQMSPHFLYNTLFSIRCLVDIGDRQKAIGIIDAFTSILKYILSYKSEFVNISQEIRFLEDYAILQKYRYGGQFELEITCVPKLYQYKIPRMILQPLIENSLFHGLGDTQEKISVTVEFAIENGDMVIVVTDDGVGFTDENYMRLNLKLKENKQSNMIGMNSIRNRIKEMFGKNYGLSIDVNYTKGARVIVKIPVID